MVKSGPIETYMYCIVLGTVMWQNHMPKLKQIHGDFLFIERQIMISLKFLALLYCSIIGIMHFVCHILITDITNITIPYTVPYIGLCLVKAAVYAQIRCSWSQDQAPDASLDYKTRSRVSLDSLTSLLALQYPMLNQPETPSYATV